MLIKLTLGEKLKDLRIAKGYKNMDDLANTEKQVALLSALTGASPEKMMKEDKKAHG